MLTDLSLSLPRRVAQAAEPVRNAAPSSASWALSGCGKSTLLNVFSGAVREAGAHRLAGAMRVTGSVTGLGTTLMIPQSPVFTAPVRAEMALYA